MDALAADVLRRCAGGEISSGVAFVRLLIVCGDLDRLQATLADLAQAGGGADLQGAIERIGDLLGRHPTGSALVLDMLGQSISVFEKRNYSAAENGTRTVSRGRDGRHHIKLNLVLDE